MTDKPEDPNSSRERNTAQGHLVDKRFLQMKTHCGKTATPTVGGIHKPQLLTELHQPVVYFRMSSARDLPSCISTTK